MGDFIQSVGKSVKFWKERGELPSGPDLSTNSSNTGVPPSFCSTSAEQRAVTCKRDGSPPCGHTVQAHGRGRDGEQCIHLWGGFLKNRNPSWQFGWGTCQKHLGFTSPWHRGVVSGGHLSSWGMLGKSQERENHQQQHSILTGICKALCHPGNGLN